MNPFGIEHEPISKIALRRVWHGTNPASARNIRRKGPMESRAAAHGDGFYAADKIEGSRVWAKVDRKNRSAAVPVYVSGPGKVRGKLRQETGFSAYDKKDVIDVGKPKHFKATLYQENVQARKAQNAQTAAAKKGNKKKLLVGGGAVAAAGGAGTYAVKRKKDSR